MPQERGPPRINTLACQPHPVGENGEAVVCDASCSHIKPQFIRSEFGFLLRTAGGVKDSLHVSQPRYYVLHGRPGFAPYADHLNGRGEVSQPVFHENMTISKPDDTMIIFPPSRKPRPPVLDLFVGRSLTVDHSHLAVSLHEDLLRIDVHCSVFFFGSHETSLSEHHRQRA
ncbi:uncharacterized protein MYCFIDRAFT_178686 [Pseudocercospora fijiensis CIRAD86]|uniref:Uncharacterized protein n=1 Tax=Pseudocercospora fijiensis (strain CIRAD86) TaxID=383855 RepID=M3AM67_PSEFD|nr:uncharacterized protein MYCFIDRAFT_178686 [Pseudocercospora fijiensis CIRAD86]EME78557.1 hypothetical protein MYCFIDRAFT_178686 [Pseudocercospora fijiensis CIRAD86]